MRTVEKCRAILDKAKADGMIYKLGRVRQHQWL